MKHSYINDVLKQKTDFFERTVLQLLVIWVVGSVLVFLGALAQEHEIEVFYSQPRMFYETPPEGFDVIVLSWGFGSIVFLLAFICLSASYFIQRWRKHGN